MVKFSEVLTAGLIVFLVAVIGHPLWISFGYTIDIVIWAIGLTFLGLAGGLHYFKRYSFLKILLGLWGYTWTILFFFEVFPSFSITLL
jgi:hypothetical protein